jgi:hypothetical protein
MSSHLHTRRLAATAALLVIGVSACSNPQPGGATSTPPTLPAFTTTSPTTSSTTATAAPVDYGRLLLTAADLSDTEDTFVERSKEAPPNGVAGSSAFFVNEKDTRAVSDTVLVYPDDATTAAAFKQASDALPTQVTGGTPGPGGVGAQSVVIRGASTDENKDVTVLLFTEGRALVRLRFESAQGDATTDRWVTGIGKMQDIALRVGLPQAQ